LIVLLLEKAYNQDRRFSTGYCKKPKGSAEGIMSRDPAQGLMLGCEVTPRTYFIQRSAEGAAFCRGVGCPHKTLFKRLAAAGGESSRK